MSEREDKCPDPVPAAPPKVEPKPPAAESIAHAMSNREERIEQAVDAVARSIDPYAFARAGDERYEHFRLDARKEARRRVEAAAPFLESSPAPDEVAVAAKRLVDTIDGMQKGAEKMGGQWYFPNPVLEDRDALRAALNEQDRASLPKGKEDRK